MKCKKKNINNKITIWNNLNNLQKVLIRKRLALAE